MNLHKNPELFEQLILLTAEYKSIDPSIIEKDYYVTLFLMKLHEKEPDFRFKTCKPFISPALTAS